MKIILYLFIVYLILSQIKFIQFTLSSYDKNKSLKYNKKQLIISTHDYEHIDIFIMLDEIIKSGDKVSIVFADKIWNRFLYYYLQLLRITNIDFIFVNEKRGTVSKMINILNKNQTVLIYLYRNNLSSGIYYTLKQTNSPLILCKIISDHKSTNYDKGFSIVSIFYNNLNVHYNVNFLNYNYNLYQDKFSFMKNIQKKLYL
tara:strand:- start:6 stop:608 length:603 start_codon:yes stop_codon:yes gene_type:complete